MGGGRRKGQNIGVVNVIRVTIPYFDVFAGGLPEQLAELGVSSL